MKYVAFIILLLAATHSQAQTILASGKLTPTAPLTKAKGAVAVVLESSGRHAIYFAEDYVMSSGVVLDLKLCGFVAARAQPVCLSQGEVRKLKGAYKMNVRFPLAKYLELRVFDADLAAEHARAVLK